MRARLHLLGHPVFTGSVAVLVVNDHFLKGGLPGWFTGKLSDFAGLLLIAILMGVAINAVRPAVFLTGAAFVALKTSTFAATLAAPFLGGVTRQDWSDLIALGILWPAALFLKHAQVPKGVSLPRFFVSFAGVGIALFGITATSCGSPDGVFGFLVRGDEIYTQIGPDPRFGTPDQDYVDWAVSTDGGASWSQVEDPPSTVLSDEERACIPVEGCFRADVVEGVQRRVDGQWTHEFNFTQDQLERLELRHGDCGDDLTGLFGPIDVVEVGSDVHIVVAMGTEGVLHRSPEGEWDRVGVMSIEPSSTFGPTWLEQGFMVPLVLLGAAVLLPLAGLIVNRPRGGWRAAKVGLLGGVFLLMASFFGRLASLDYAVFGALLGLASVAVFLWSLVVFFRGAPPEAASGTSTEEGASKEP